MDQATAAMLERCGVPGRIEPREGVNVYEMEYWRGRRAHAGVAALLSRPGTATGQAKRGTAPAGRRCEHCDKPLSIYNIPAAGAHTTENGKRRALHLCGNCEPAFLVKYNRPVSLAAARKMPKNG